MDNNDAAINSQFQYRSNMTADPPHFSVLVDKNRPPDLVSG